jgi:hypothetical protein
MIPPLRERLLTNDMAALIACQRPQAKFSDVAVPTLIYAGSADPIHDPARQTASEIPGAQFVSLPGLSHPAALCRSDLVLPHVEPFLAKVLDAGTVITHHIEAFSTSFWMGAHDRVLRRRVALNFLPGWRKGSLARSAGGPET